MTDHKSGLSEGSTYDRGHKSNLSEESTYVTDQKSNLSEGSTFLLVLFLYFCCCVFHNNRVNKLGNIRMS
jgi:hypothetical protein